MQAPAEVDATIQSNFMEEVAFPRGQNWWLARSPTEFWRTYALPSAVP